MPVAACCRLTLIMLVLFATAIFQHACLLVLRLANRLRARSGKAPWALPELLVPPRALLMVMALTVMPASHAAGQLLGAGGDIRLYVAGGLALGYITCYIAALVFILSWIGARAWALGIIYGMYGQLNSVGMTTAEAGEMVDEDQLDGDGQPKPLHVSAAFTAPGRSPAPTPKGKVFVLPALFS